MEPSIGTRWSRACCWCILGLRCKVIADLGAYHQLLTPLIPTGTALMILGCYKIPAVSVHITGAFTNKMATDAYRGAGRPEATYPGFPL